MPGLVPGIHDFLRYRKQDVDGRDEPGHDEHRDVSKLRDYAIHQRGGGWVFQCLTSLTMGDHA